MSEKELEKINDFMNDPDFIDWFKKNTELHGTQADYGIKLKPTTIVAAFKEYIETAPVETSLSPSGPEGEECEGNKSS
ncbi:hypothetical protein J2129_000821 [Methanofollis sp. W23]|uniref:hypothetical protein n=1 Tax=Methanofollis sp. W23 TaxID=2817849 RepID=UPI001AE5C770|nr:hypothetical protein [Methanofollis sp. W23]MBP2145367.1 hypothetical protein [Methanofollis sp. W23]